MIKTATTYGVISGAIIIASMMLGLLTSDMDGFFASEYFGYLIMLIALSMIFIGIKRHRDIELGGVIKFLPAFGLGLGISAVAGIVYVAVWEVYLASTNFAFINDYTTGLIDAKKAEGLSGAALDSFIAEMDELKAGYAKPYVRLPMTFLEIFPVGVVISLISAALLKNPKLLPAR